MSHSVSGGVGGCVFDVSPEVGWGAQAGEVERKKKRAQEDVLRDPYVDSLRGVYFVEKSIMRTTVKEGKT